MTESDGREDEYPVAAGALDQRFIGLPFGISRGSTTIYGTLAGVRLQPEEVVLWIDGIPGADATLRLSPDDLLYFSRSTWTARVQSLLEEIARLGHPVAGA
ncbi:hypothetical protein [Cellulomonas soli]|uniref:Uncharacterized protein n=1 Tax=Cellulomonas soli TaxID=931535 RepID=A0A512P8Q6_9CELL|nr:hypothetical protein [Cellulomonas soli]NYI57803.1 hypothetical protein [Cellulomonas soli]GEP67587.1 hypothetical protein CSO01_03020 [Cellulomonas soli]